MSAHVSVAQLAPRIQRLHALAAQLLPQDGVVRDRLGEVALAVLGAIELLRVSPTSSAAITSLDRNADRLGAVLLEEALRLQARHDRLVQMRTALAASLAEVDGVIAANGADKGEGTQP